MKKNEKFLQEKQNLSKQPNVIIEVKNNISEIRNILDQQNTKHRREGWEI